MKYESELEHPHQLSYKKCHLDTPKPYFIILTHHLPHLLFFVSKE